jgi:hypothetical protein
MSIGKTILKENQCTEYELDNGLFVVLQRTPTRTVAGKLRVHHGALHEEEGEEGLAHFLEHNLISGGTEKYTPEEVDELRVTFGNFNAYTAPHQTMGRYKEPLQKFHYQGLVFEGTRTDLPNTVIRLERSYGGIDQVDKEQWQHHGIKVSEEVF